MPWTLLICLLFCLREQRPLFPSKLQGGAESPHQEKLVSFLPLWSLCEDPKGLEKRRDRNPSAYLYKPPSRRFLQNIFAMKRNGKEIKNKKKLQYPEGRVPPSDTNTPSSLFELQQSKSLELICEPSSCKENLKRFLSEHGAREVDWG